MPSKTILPWETKLEALHRYRATVGVAAVPQNYVDPTTGFRLGRWVANLRQRQDFLNEQQLEDLDHAGFVWEQQRSKVIPWATKIDILRRFKEQWGHTMVPKDYTDPETGFRLGAMVDRIRQSKDRHNKIRLQELDQLGFVWNKYEARWEIMFQLLQEYKSIHGHAHPQVNEEFKGKPLGQWVGIQKQLYSRKKRGITINANMPEDRVARLEAIGFEWTWTKGRKNSGGKTGSTCGDSTTSSQHQEGGGGDASSVASLSSDSSISPAVPPLLPSPPPSPSATLPAMMESQYRNGLQQVVFVVPTENTSSAAACFGRKRKLDDVVTDASSSRMSKKQLSVSRVI